MGDILGGLNDAQREAVTHVAGPLMVLAGAGSGKTRVITRRIAWLLDQGVEASRILAVTFTNKAAGEMARRVLELGGQRVHVSTFHSACARFLRRDGHHLGYPPGFSIYDTYDRDVCLRQLLEGRGVELGGAVTPGKVGARISRLKNLGVSPEAFVQGLGEVDSAVRKVYRPYLDRMLELGAMDFDDLLVRFVDLLASHPAVAAVYQERYRHLLVDEFQDTNLVQYELIKLLAQQHRNVCVVGDPDQSIYRFRGAELRNILDFATDYPDVTTIRLEQNYRSTGCILAAAQGVIERNRERMAKTLRTEADFGAPVAVRRFDSEREEAESVARAVTALLRDGVSPEEIGVFYRTHYLSRGVEQAFRQAGVAYEVVGGLTFYERREIKDVLAFLRVLVNPLDDVSMLRIVNVPPRGVGKVSLDKLVDRAADAGLSLFEAVCDAEARGVLSGKARHGVEQLAAVLQRIDVAASPDRVIGDILEGTGYLDYACNLGDPQEVSREENLAELVSDATRFAKEEGGGLAAYLQHVSLQTSEDESGGEGPKVAMMTVHAAKGLEFDYVFVLGLEDGIFPHSRSLLEPAELEEERRLLYVALTRARQQVTLSHAAFRMAAGVSSSQDVSRFLGEIPDACIDRGAGGSRDGWVYEFDDVRDGDGGIDFDDGGAEPGQLAVGARVVHPYYGHGEVLRIQGSGARAKVVVRFRDGVERMLIPEHAGLQVVPTSGGSW